MLQQFFDQVVTFLTGVQVFFLQVFEIVDERGKETRFCEEQIDGFLFSVCEHHISIGRVCPQVEILRKVFQRTAQKMIPLRKKRAEPVQQQLSVFRGKWNIKILRYFIASPCFHKAAEPRSRVKDMVIFGENTVLPAPEKVVQQRDQFGASGEIGTNDPLYQVRGQERDNAGLRLQRIILVIFREKFQDHLAGVFDRVDRREERGAFFTAGVKVLLEHLDDLRLSVQDPRLEIGSTGDRAGTGQDQAGQSVQVGKM